VRVDEIARHLNKSYEGSGELEISGAAALESAGPHG
jgi:hypothetical protein